MNNSGKYLTWAVLSVVGAFAAGYIALNRGADQRAVDRRRLRLHLSDRIPFYGRYIAKTVLGVDGTRMTPAVRHNDGLDYVPTDKKCCSVTISRRLPGQARWWGRYWPRRWATCRG